MKKILILSTLLISLALLSNCRWITGAKLSPMKFMQTIEVEGTPKFKLGFKDGCASTFYSRGNALYRLKYGWKFNTDLIDDPEYSFGRKRGYNYCFGYVVGGTSHFRGGWDRYIMGHGPAFDMGKGSIDGVTGSYSGNIFDVLNVPSGGVSANVEVLSGGSDSVMSAHPFWGSRGMESGKLIGW